MDSGVKAIFERVVKKQMKKPEGMAAHSCQYFIGGRGNEYCKATTQVSCRKCRAYEPDMWERRSLLAEYILSLEKKTEELTAETDRLHEKIGQMFDEIQDFKVFAMLVTKEMQEEKEEEGNV